MIPRYPAEKFGLPGFGRTCRPFWPPPVHVEHPRPTGRYPDSEAALMPWPFITYVLPERHHPQRISLPEIRWPGDSQRKSGRFARIDWEKKKNYFHNVRAIPANRLKPAIDKVGGTIMQLGPFQGLFGADWDQSLRTPQPQGRAEIAPNWAFFGHLAPFQAKPPFAKPPFGFPRFLTTQHQRIKFMFLRALDLYTLLWHQIVKIQMAVKSRDFKLQSALQNRSRKSPLICKN